MKGDTIMSSTSKVTVDGLKRFGTKLIENTDERYALAGTTGSGSGTSDYTDLTNKPSINNVTLSGNKSLADLGIITKAVDDLTNYYTKSNTYTKSEVDSLIGAITGGVSLEVVQELPSTNISTTKIYLVAKTTSGTNNAYDEYIYVNSNWEKIGDTVVDLTGYVTTTALSEAGYLTASDITGKQDTLTFDSAPTASSTNPVTSGGVYTALAAKQDTLTLDSTPTQNSTNGVTSGGVYTAISTAVTNGSVTVDSEFSSSSENPVQNKVIKNALDGKQATLSFDSTPTASSTNPVTSGGVYTALSGKQDSLTFDSTPTASSTNPVTSGGVYTAINTAIGSASSLDISVVNSLPTENISTTTIYLVAKSTSGTQNVYDEYIYVNNAWEKIGDTAIDLSSYVTSTALASILDDSSTGYAKKSDLSSYVTTTALGNAGYVTSTSLASTLDDTTNGYVKKSALGSVITTGEIDTMIAAIFA